MQAAVESRLADVMLISDPSEECLQEALKLAPSGECRKEFDAVLAHPDVDAVVIATPSALHMQQAVQAFEAGKAVFCQKPLGRNADEVKAVIEAARSADKLLGVDFSYRYTAAFQAVLDVVRSGELGRIFSVELKFHNAYGPDKPWFYDHKLSGGGCVLDLGIHLIDLMLYALDFPELVRVNSRLFANGVPARVGESVEDFADVSMTLDDGIAAHLTCSWNLNAGKEAEIEVSFYGTKGAVSMHNVNGSFYDFAALRFEKTRTHTLVSPPDAWGGRALVDWIKQLSISDCYNSTADEFLKSAIVLDKIYGKT